MESPFATPTTSAFLPASRVDGVSVGELLVLGWVSDMVDERGGKVPMLRCTHECRKSAEWRARTKLARKEKPTGLDARWALRVA